MVKELLIKYNIRFFENYTFHRRYDSITVDFFLPDHNTVIDSKNTTKKILNTYYNISSVITSPNEETIKSLKKHTRKSRINWKKVRSSLSEEQNHTIYHTIIKNILSELEITFEQKKKFNDIIVDFYMKEYSFVIEITSNQSKEDKARNNTRHAKLKRSHNIKLIKQLTPHEITRYNDTKYLIKTIINNIKSGLYIENYY